MRKAKSTQKQSLRAAVSQMVIEDVPQQIAALRVAEADLRDAGVIADVVLREGERRSVTVELATPAG